MTRSKRSASKARSHSEDSAGTPAEFFARHPYFFASEFLHGRDRRAAERALHYHCTQKHLFNIRKGTYVWYARRKNPDPFLLGTRLVGGLIAYSSALWFHGLIRPQKQLTVLARKRLDFEWAGITYRGVLPPKAHPDAVLYSSAGTDFTFRDGLPLGVTDISRTIVDCLDRPDLSPDFVQLVDIFRSRDDLDMDLMAKHALQLGSAVTAARVLYFLDHHPLTRRKRPDLEKLMANIPRRHGTMDPRVPLSRCVKNDRWKLYVPTALADHLERR